MTIKVYLDKDKDYVFCFKKETIINEENCDYYDYNRECEAQKEYLKRTHNKGTLAGYKCRGISESILNSCNYCLKNHKQECYALPPEAEKLLKKQKKGYDKLISKFNIWRCKD